MLALCGMILNYRKARLRDRESDSSSLTTRELEGLVRKAVAEATAPLSAQLAALEERLEDPLRLPGPDHREDAGLPSARARGQRERS